MHQKVVSDIHKETLQAVIANQEPNRAKNKVPPEMFSDKDKLPRIKRTTLAQLR